MGLASEDGAVWWGFGGREEEGGFGLKVFADVLKQFALPVPKDFELFSGLGVMALGAYGSKVFPVVASAFMEGQTVVNLERSRQQLVAVGAAPLLTCRFLIALVRSQPPPLDSVSALSLLPLAAH